MNFVADKFDLKKDILFNEKVTSAAFDYNTKQWNVITNNNYNFRSKFLITV